MPAGVNAVASGEERAMAADEGKTPVTPAASDRHGGQAPIGRVRTEVPDSSSIRSDGETSFDRESSTFERAIRRASESGERDGLRPRLKGPNKLGQRYFDAIAERAEARLARQSRRHNLLSKFHNPVTFPPEEEWQQALRVLDSLTPAEGSADVRRIATIKLPAGIATKWAADAREATLEILRSTGSHVDMSLPIHDGHGGQSHETSCSSLTLYGTRFQNAKALRLIQDRRLWRVERLSKVNGALSSPFLDGASDDTRWQGHRPEEVMSERSICADDLERVFQDLEQQLDRPEEAELQHALEDIIHITPSERTTFRFSGLAARWPTTNIPELGQAVEVAIAGTRQPSVDLMATVASLTAPHPGHKLRMVARRFHYHHPRPMIRDALVTLLTKSGNIASTTALILQRAWAYLAKNGFLPSVREIMGAHDAYAASGAEGSGPAVGVATFNALLAHVSMSEDVHTFRYYLLVMRNRGIGADHHTWLAFFDLTLRRFPHLAGVVDNRLKNSVALKDYDTNLLYLRLTIPRRLQAYLDTDILGRAPQHPVFDTFIAAENQRLTGVRWLTASCASRIAKILLDRGLWRDAFRLVAEMVRQRRKPNTVVLEVFLDAASKAGCEEPALAVAVLQLFSSSPHAAMARDTDDGAGNPPGSEEVSVDELSPSSALTDVAAEARVAPLPWHIEPRAPTYRKLLHLAYVTHHWNLFRVVWQHACCAGEEIPYMKRLLRRSLHSPATPSAPPSSEAETKDWFARFARLAIGIQPLRPEPATAPSGDDNDSPVETAPLERSVDHYWLSLYRQDLDAFRKLRPKNSLASDALEAWRTDVEWKKEGLGSPNGSELWGSPSKMLEAMERRAFRVEISPNLRTGPGGGSVKTGMAVWEWQPESRWAAAEGTGERV